MAFSFRNGRGLRKGSSLDKTSRIFLLGILIFFGFVVYFYQLFYLQVIQGSEYRTQSKTISSQVNTIPAQRG